MSPFLGHREPTIAEGLSSNAAAPVDAGDPVSAQITRVVTRAAKSDDDRKLLLDVLGFPEDDGADRADQADQADRADQADQEPAAARATVPDPDPAPEGTPEPV